MMLHKNLKKNFHPMKKAQNQIHTIVCTKKKHTNEYIEQNY